jgi:hypothetical protein
MENTQNEGTLLSDIFNIFVSNDTMRPVLTKPFEFNNKIYATDAHVLIRINKSDCDFNVEPQPNAPNCESVTPNENMNLLLSVNKTQFEEYKTEDEMVDVGEDIDCDTCDGDGEVEWEFEHYTNYFDCPVCDGSGYKETSTEIKTGNKTYGNILIKIKDSYLHISKFSKLLEVQEKLNESIYLTHLSTPNKAVLFKVGICDVLIMPVMVSAYDTEEKVIDLNI